MGTSFLVVISPIIHLTYLLISQIYLFLIKTWFSILNEGIGVGFVVPQWTWLAANKLSNIVSMILLSKCTFEVMSRHNNNVCYIQIILL